MAILPSEGGDLRGSIPLCPPTDLGKNYKCFDVYPMKDITRHTWIRLTTKDSAKKQKNDIYFPKFQRFWLNQGAP